VEASNPPESSSRRFQRYRSTFASLSRFFATGKQFLWWGRSSELGEDGIGNGHWQLEPGEVVSMELSLPLTPFLLSAGPGSLTAMGCDMASEFLP